MPDCSKTQANTQSAQPKTVRGSRLISRVLSPALRLWLQTQIEQAENLQFKISSSDRCLLRGQVTQVNLSADGAVYRGLQLGQVSLIATDIHVNLGQVMRGKALQLLSPFLITGRVVLSQSDLNASLQTTTMAEALQNFLVKIYRRGDRVSEPLAQRLEAIAAVPLDCLKGSGHVRGEVLTISLHDQKTQASLVLRTRLQIQQERLLTLLQPQLLEDIEAPTGLPLTELEGLQVDLGADVEIQHFALEDGQLKCQGSVRVQPGGDRESV